MIKQQQAELEGKALVSTILFDHKSLVLHDRLPLEKIEPLTEKDYEVRGTTALLDAVGDAVKHIKNIHKYAREEDRPQKTLFVITTDGMENSSINYDYNQVKRLVEQQKEKGWEFIFLGANIDAVKVAGHIGIDARRAVNYHADSQGTEHVFGAINDFMQAFSSGGGVDIPDDVWRKLIDQDFKERKK